MYISVTKLITILFLSANPENTDKLDLNKEINEIRDEIRYASGKEVFKIEQYHDIAISQLQKQLLEYKPQILHFSGHGSPRSALIFRNKNGDVEVVPSNALSGLFKILGKNIPLVFLNACYSQEQAEAIAKHVNFVIGMSRAISDDGARIFAVSFYRALAFGESVQDAFDLAKNALPLSSIPEEAIPQMCTNDEIDPSKWSYKDIDKINNPPETVTQVNSPICKQLDSINQNIDKLQMQENSPAEFFKFIYPLIKEFSSNRANKEKFGELKVKILNSLSISLGTIVQEIKEYEIIGDLQTSKIKTNRAKQIAYEINGIINDLCTQS